MVDLTNRHRHGLNVPTIRDLIQEAIDAGRSTRQLSVDSGGRVKHQTFQDLSKSPPKEFPKELKTIQGMAVALNVPEATVVLAYAHSLGVDVSIESGLAARLPKGTDGIGIEMQNAIVAVVRAAVKLVPVPTDDLQAIEERLRRLTGEELDQAVRLTAELADQRERAAIEDYLAEDPAETPLPENVVGLSMPYEDRPLPTAARRTPSGHQKGQSDQGVPGGDEGLD